jgi:simple sugar transport system permease protein
MNLDLQILWFLIQQTMFFAIPLLVVALGGMFSERGGTVNIALEGIMIFGAFTGILFINKMQAASALSGHLLLIAALLIAAATGIVVSLAHAFASINMKADQIISGTAINILAPAFAIFVARVVQNIQQIRFENQFRIAEVPVLGKIPAGGDMFFKNAYITTYLGFILLAGAWFLLFKTRFGLRLRSCGEHPQAADSVGISVYKMRYAGVLLSGALAGMGGVIFIIPVSNTFTGTVSGYGFLALAVLIFGQWKPWRILGAAFFFGFMRAVAASYAVIPLLKDAGLPSNFYKMMPFIITLLVLAFTSKRSQAPRAIGVPYDKGVR